MKAMNVDDEPPQDSSGDFLSGDIVAHDGGIASNDEREEEPNQRPLQLPRVGWGTDDDEDGAKTNAQPPIDIQASLPDVKHDDGDGVALRAMSRNTEGDLAPIPEDISMHGAWPDYYPDVLGCYNYDHDRKRYKYRRCVPATTRRLCAVLIIVFAAIIGSKVSSKTSGKPHRQPQPSSPSSDSDVAAASLKNVSKANVDGDAYQPPVYESIADTLQPIMFDDSTQWDGSFFHAFEFCGTVYNRVPCPYIAYCPLGPGEPPLGGTKISINESWAPIFNTMGKNDAQHPDWVQLGSDRTCELYSMLYGHQPPWENVKEGDESSGITRHVMCCLESVDGAWSGGEGGQWFTPNYLDRPPSLEEDELEKPIPMREEEGKSEEQPNKSGGNRMLRSNALGPKDSQAQLLFAGDFSGE